MGWLGGQKPRIVIIGGGFGGLSAARALRSAPADVIVLDRVNHHLFQPLLYQVATATLPPTDIIAPIRWLLRQQRNATVLLCEVTNIDLKRNCVHAQSDAGAAEIEFDFLIVAAGSRHSYFGHGEWEPNAPGLKSITDAIEMRSRFLLAFERAEWESDRNTRISHQTFVIVGGGPTGVELAGILPEIARRAMRKDFRILNPDDTRVVLVEGGPRLLPSFSEETSRRVERDLADLGVEVRTNTMVTGINADSVQLGNEMLRTHTVFWAAGNAASPLGKLMDAETDKQGRVKVERDLSIPGHENVFVVGDLAAFAQDGAQLPGVAQVAIQGGRAAGKNILRTLRGQERRAFRYQNRGDAATIGRNRAIIQFPGFALSGRAGWFFWLFLHILYLAGFRNRLSVLIEWGYAYFSYQRGSRLITRG